MFLHLSLYDHWNRLWHPLQPWLLRSDWESERRKERMNEWTTDMLQAQLWPMTLLGLASLRTCVDIGVRPPAMCLLPDCMFSSSLFYSLSFSLFPSLFLSLSIFICLPLTLSLSFSLCWQAKVERSTAETGGRELSCSRWNIEHESTEAWGVSCCKQRDLATNTPSIV